MELFAPISEYRDVFGRDCAACGHAFVETDFERLECTACGREIEPLTQRQTERCEFLLG